MSGLRKAFYRKLKMAHKMSEVEREFNMAIGDSKYADVEIPDAIVECIDYGNDDMTYREFLELMNEALKEQEE